MSTRRALPLALVAALLAGAGCAHAPAATAVVPPAGARWVVVPHMKLVPQTGDADCGPAALEMALARWGAVPAADAWRPRGGEDRERAGFSAGTLRDEARRVGFRSYVFEGTFDDLAAEIGAGRPVVVGLVRLQRGERLSHFAVVVGHDLPRQRWLLADPALGVQAVTTDTLRDDWARAGWVTLVMFPDRTTWMAEAP
jgi:predicted double-glycine peptidase